MPLAAHDVGLHPHAAGDDAQLAGARRNRTLTRHPDAFTEVFFQVGVIVMAVDGCNLRFDLATERVLQRLLHQKQHDVAVQCRIVLAPTQRGDVLVEFDAAFIEPRQIAIRQRRRVAPRQLLRGCDRRFADGFADVTAARMQHDPNALAFIEAQFDKMVASTECAQLLPHALVIELADACHDLQAVEARRQRVETTLQRQTFQPLTAGLDHVAMVVEPDRHIALDLVPHGLQVVRQIRRGKLRLHRHHTAADIDTHSGRNNRTARRDHTAHRRTHAKVHVRHDRDMPGQNRQGGNVADLLERFLLDFHVASPEAHAVHGLFVMIF